MSYGIVLWPINNNVKFYEHYALPKKICNMFYAFFVPILIAI